MSLPPDWTRYETDDGKEYFHNSVTNMTQWDAPKKVDPLAFIDSGGTSDVFQYQPSAVDLSAPTVPAYAASAPTGSMVEMQQRAASPTSETVSLNAGAAPIGAIGSGGGGAAGAGAGGGGGGSFMGSLGGLVAGAAMTAVAGAAAGQAAAGGDAGAGGCSGFLLERAQQLFDVSTNDVIQRLRMVVPLKPPDGAKEDLKSRPDFYGPFWIATTAVLFLAATGNFARLIQAGDHRAFQPDYSLVSVAATMIYGTLGVLPAAARGAIFFAGDEGSTVDLRQIVCVCGYSMAPMIPVSMLCLIPLASLRWLLTLLGAALSLYFLHTHLLTDIQVTAPTPKLILTAAPCVTVATIFLVYRVHFF